MPVVTFRRKDLVRVIGRDIPLSELAERMPMLGGDLDRADEKADSLTIEWFPDRPDLLTLEGTGRAMRAFLDVRQGLPSYAVERPRTTLRIDASVAAVRPFAALCYVRGVPFDDAYVQTLVDAQEKLTFSPGRKRRKVAIGIHDAKGLDGPFTYTAVGPDEKPFIPLGMERPMTPAQILAGHPKGIEYGHLLSTAMFPVFLDGKGEVVSMPPIINAQRTALTAATRDVLIDVTGTDAKAVRQTVALLATSLAERGGTIEAVTVHDASGEWQCPALRPTERVLHTDDVAALLGLQWSGEEVAACLRRMGHDAVAFDNKVQVQVAAWRQDILHPVDLMEDVGIGFGFDRFPGDLPQQATFGSSLPHQGLEDALRELLVGHGWLEARTLTLSDAKAQWRNWGEPDGQAVTLLNPVVEDQTLLRTRLLPSLLHVLAQNRHRSLPQRLFEVGQVVTGPNRIHVAGVEVSAKAGFSDAKGLVEALVRDARLPVSLAPATKAGFIAGRTGMVQLDGRTIGHFGELHPDTLAAFGLTAPAIAFEWELDPLVEPN